MLALVVLVLGSTAGAAVTPDASFAADASSDAATARLGGCLTFTAAGLSAAQVQTLLRAALSVEFNLTEASIHVRVTRRRFLLESQVSAGAPDGPAAESRRLAEAWAPTFEIDARINRVHELIDHAKAIDHGGLSGFATVLQEELARACVQAWRGFGAKTACRLDESDRSENGHGAAEVRGNAHSLEECKLACERDINCHGIEWTSRDVQQCQVWSRPIGGTRSVEANKTCFSVQRQAALPDFVAVTSFCELIELPDEGGEGGSSTVAEAGAPAMGLHKQDANLTTSSPFSVIGDMLPPWWLQYGIVPDGPVKDMGSFTASTFSDDQKVRYGVTENGTVVDPECFKAAIEELQGASITTSPSFSMIGGMLPPWWLQYGIDPEGPVKDMGSFTASTFSEDQQVRYGVTENGTVVDPECFKGAIEELQAHGLTSTIGSAAAPMPDVDSLGEGVTLAPTLTTLAPTVTLGESFATGRDVDLATGRDVDTQRDPSTIPLLSTTVVSSASASTTERSPMQTMTTTMHTSVDYWQHAFTSATTTGVDYWQYAFTTATTTGIDHLQRAFDGVSVVATPEASPQNFTPPAEDLDGNATGEPTPNCTDREADGGSACTTQTADEGNSTDGAMSFADHVQHGVQAVASSIHHVVGAVATGIHHTVGRLSGGGDAGLGNSTDNSTGLADGDEGGMPLGVVVPNASSAGSNASAAEEASRGEAVEEASGASPLPNATERLGLGGTGATSLGGSSNCTDCASRPHAPSAGESNSSNDTEALEWENISDEELNKTWNDAVKILSHSNESKNVSIQVVPAGQISGDEDGEPARDVLRSSTSTARSSSRAATTTATVSIAFTATTTQPVVPAGVAVEPPLVCCEALTAECMACASRQTVEEFCRSPGRDPGVTGCDEAPAWLTTDALASTSTAMTTTQPAVPVGVAVEPPPVCCEALTAECMACVARQTVTEFCRNPGRDPDVVGCDEAPAVLTPDALASTSTATTTTQPAVPVGVAVEPPPVCCKALTAECMACVTRQTVKEFCRNPGRDPDVVGCDEAPAVLTPVPTQTATGAALAGDFTSSTVPFTHAVTAESVGIHGELQSGRLQRLQGSFAFHADGVLRDHVEEASRRILAAVYDVPSELLRVDGVGSAEERWRRLRQQPVPGRRLSSGWAVSYTVDVFRENVKVAKEKAAGINADFTAFAETFRRQLIAEGGEEALLDSTFDFAEFSVLSEVVTSTHPAGDLDGSAEGHLSHGYGAHGVLLGVVVVASTACLALLALAGCMRRRKRTSLEGGPAYEHINESDGEAPPFMMCLCCGKFISFC